MSKARDLASGQNGVRPYAIQTNTTTMAFSGVQELAVSVTFPVSSRFTSTPRIWVAAGNNVIGRRCNFSTYGQSTTGFTLNGWYNPGVLSSTVGVSWIAVQGSPTGTDA